MSFTFSGRWLKEAERGCDTWRCSILSVTMRPQACRGEARHECVGRRVVTYWDLVGPCPFLHPTGIKWFPANGYNQLCRLASFVSIAWCSRDLFKLLWILTLSKSLEGQWVIQQVASKDRQSTSCISRGWANRRSLHFSMKFLSQNLFLLLDVHPQPWIYHHRTHEFLFLPWLTVWHSGIQTLDRFSLLITIALMFQLISFSTLIRFVESPRVFLLQSLLATLKLSSFWKYSLLVLQYYKASKKNVLDIIYITNAIWF